MSRFFDPRFSHLIPYVPGEQPEANTTIKLNTNESPYPPSPKVVEAVTAAAQKLYLYPELSGGALAAGLAKAFCVGAENILLGNGSDEILSFIFQSMCPAGVAFADLTYGFYKVYCSLYGITPQIVPLREDFTLAPEDYFALGKTIVIANPNAPTGLALSMAQVEAILQNNPDNLVVLDEAYIHFGAESAAPLLKKYNNLLLVGTFSKHYGMAGGRLGYAAGAADLIEDLNRIRFSINPYNLNRMTMAAGAAALDDGPYYTECWRKIIATRERAAKALRLMGFVCTASVANFLFISHPSADAETLYGHLKEKGILVRWFDSPRIRNHLRVTVGSDSQMDALLAELEIVLNEPVR